MPRAGSTMLCATTAWKAMAAARNVLAAERRCIFEAAGGFLFGLERERIGWWEAGDLVALLCSLLSPVWGRESN